ncbi:MAG: (2Fe-2S) ferredoxin domain-containing protein [Clostridia bacterium]|nr:(2Fe-2S) ferredoxin domain-containing protein [Clostridia bacterium]
MKSIADLEAIRQKTLSKVNLRREHEGIRIVVGMSTSGIAAGARELVTAFLSELGKHELLNVVVMQNGGIGGAGEPVVEVLCPGKEKVTYVNVKPEMVARIVEDHIVNGKPVVEYTISEAK